MPIFKIDQPIVLKEGSIPTDEYYVNRFISGQDVYVNWEKWTSGLMDKCFIIGMSGSGKSTLGSKLAQQFNCYCVHTDRFRGNVHYTDEQLFKEDPIIYRYFDTVWGLKNRFKIKDMSKDQRTQEFEKFIDWVLKQNDRIIIEGAVEKVLIKEPKLQQYPIIFKGTSMMKSMYRMVRRELIEKPTFYGAPISWILKFVARYSDMMDLNNQARDSVMRHNPSYEKVHEAVTPIIQWPPTHKQMCDIYEQQCMMEASESRPVHQSGNVTRYKEGAYFDEDTNMWMRHLYPGETNSSPNATLTEEGIMDLDRSFLDAEYTEAINEETGIIDQPVMFSGDDIYVNFDKFKSGEAKTCLITGLSGSGKSTLAKKIAEKMGAYYVETDTISFKISSLHPERANWGYIKDHDKYLYKYFKEVGLEPDCMLKYDWNGDEKKEIVTPFIRWLCLERDDDGLVVCEGGDVAIALRDVPELGEMPIVFKGTSILKSMFRRFLRSTDNKGLLSAIKAAVTYYKSQYGKMIPEVNAARKTILGNHEYQTQHEAAR